MMDGTLKLGLMVFTSLLVVAAISWVLAEVIIFFSKDDK
jgi:hypothetical protein